MYSCSVKGAEGVLELGEQFIPMDVELKQTYTEVIDFMKKRTRSAPRRHYPILRNTSDSSQVHERPKLQREKICPWNLVKLAEDCSLSLPLRALDTETKPSQTFLGKREPQNFDQDCQVFESNEDEYKELGKKLEPKLRDLYGYKYLKPSAPNNKCTIRANYKIDPYDVLPQLDRFEIDLLVSNNALCTKASLHPRYQVQLLPVEFKVCSEDLLFIDFIEQKIGDILSPDPTEADQCYKESIRQLLIKKQVLSESGQLRPSHSWVLQTMVYAMMMKENTDKVGQLVILSTHGLYIHTFLVSTELQQKITKLICDIRIRLTPAKYVLRDTNLHSTPQQPNLVMIENSQEVLSLTEKEEASAPESLPESKPKDLDISAEDTSVMMCEVLSANSNDASAFNNGYSEFFDGDGHQTTCSEFSEYVPETNSYPETQEFNEQRMFEETNNQ